MKMLIQRDVWNLFGVGYLNGLKYIKSADEVYLCVREEINFDKIKLWNWKRLYISQGFGSYQVIMPRIL